MNKISSKLILLTAIVTLLSPTELYAQVDNTKRRDENAKKIEKNENNKEKSKNDVVRNNGPITRNGTTASGKTNDAADESAEVSKPLLQILTEGEKVNGVFNIGYTVDKSVGKKAISENFALKAQVPISESNQNSVFDIKNIGNGTTLTLSYSRYRTQLINITDRDYRDFLNQATDLCIKNKNPTAQETTFINTIIRKVSSENDNKSHYEKLENANVELSNEIKPFNNKVEKAIKENENKKEGEEKIAETHYLTGAEKLIYANNKAIEKIVVCWNDVEEIKYINEHLKKDNDKFDAYKDFIDGQKKPTLFYGVDATVGYDEFDVLDRTNFLVDDVGRVAYDGTAYLGIIGKKGNWSSRISASYTRGFESPEVAEFCQNISGTMDQNCISGPDGRPIRSESAFVSGELRVLFPFGKKPDIGEQDDRSKFGIAPEFTWDVDDGEWAIDVPVYLQRNEKGVLDGGIRFGYRSDMNDFGVGLFVGVPF